MDIVDEVRQILIAAKPANSNKVPCACSMRPVPQPGVNELLRQLESYRPVGRTWERPAAQPGGRLIFQPAPWVRAMVKAAE